MCIYIGNCLIPLMPSKNSPYPISNTLKIHLIAGWK